MSFKFVKDLCGDEPLVRFSSDLDETRECDRLEVDHRDTSRIIHCIDAGFQLAGIRQDVTAGRILVILDRSKPA